MVALPPQTAKGRALSFPKVPPIVSLEQISPKEAPVKASCPLPPLDGVRGMAAIFVVLCHSKYSGFIGGPAGMGTFGVMLFFCLSGFLMVHRNLPERSTLTDWVAFEIQRFIRVYPPFFLATLNVLFFSAAALKGSAFTTDWHDLIPIWLLREPGGIFWTISVELKFYLVYPAIALILARRSGSSIALVCCSWLARTLAVAHTWMFAFFSFFVAGAIAAVLIQKAPPSWYHPTSGGSAALGWSSLLLVLGAATTGGYNDLSDPELWSTMWRSCWYLGPICAFFIANLALAGGALKWLFANPVSRAFGRISYSLYLTHTFVLRALGGWLAPNLIGSTLAFGTILVVAILFYALAEYPFSRLGVGLRRRLATGRAKGRTCREMTSTEDMSASVECRNSDGLESERRIVDIPLL